MNLATSFRIGDLVRHVKTFPDESEDRGIGIVIAIRRPAPPSSLGCVMGEVQGVEDGIEVLNGDGTITVTIEPLLEYVVKPPAAKKINDVCESS